MVQELKFMKKYLWYVNCLLVKTGRKKKGKRGRKKLE